MSTGRHARAHLVHEECSVDFLAESLQGVRPTAGQAVAAGRSRVIRSFVASWERTFDPSNMLITLVTDYKEIPALDASRGQLPRRTIP
jgi:hypothetical protein